MRDLLAPALSPCLPHTTHLLLSPFPLSHFVKYLVTEMRTMINMLPLSKSLGKLFFLQISTFCHILKSVLDMAAMSEVSERL